MTASHSRPNSHNTAGGTERPAGAARPTVQALRLLDVYQELVRHKDVLGGAAITDRQRALHICRRRRRGRRRQGGLGNVGAEPRHCTRRDGNVVGARRSGAEPDWGERRGELMDRTRIRHMRIGHRDRRRHLRDQQGRQLLKNLRLRQPHTAGLSASQS